MTKQNYELIAQSIRRSIMAHPIGHDLKKDDAYKQGGRKMASLIANDLCASLRSYNPLFNDSKFMDACGL